MGATHWSEPANARATAAVTVTVLGASGFVGTHLVAALRTRGSEVIECSVRDPVVAARACEGADVVVNLAGEPVAQRWNASVKEQIRSSRVDVARGLIDRLSALPSRPSAYVSASAIGYYGMSETKTFTEDSPPGDDFLAQVCIAWEAEANRAAAAGMRVAVVRNGLVLGRDGGALAKLLPIFKLGGGGTAGDGSQWYSWVHIDDAVAIFLLAIDGAVGVFNATAPQPVRNRDFTSALAHVVRRPAVLPTPEFALRLLLGEGATMLTRGQRALPQRALALGYEFKYPTIEAAFAALVGGARRSGSSVRA